MRYFVVLCSFVTISFAYTALCGEPHGIPNYTLPGTDDILDTYAYNITEQMGVIAGSYGIIAAVDDYNGVNANIHTYTMWAVTTVAPPTTIQMLVVPDDSGVPSAAGPSSQNSYPVSCTDTGITYSGYPIWLSVVDCSAAPIPVSTPIWLGTFRNGSSDWYPVSGTTVTGIEAYRTVTSGWVWEPFSNEFEAGDLFKIIEGEPESSLSRSTWAEIKLMF